MRKSKKFAQLSIFIPLYVLLVGCAAPQVDIISLEAAPIKAIEVSTFEDSPATLALTPTESIEIVAEEEMPDPTASPPPLNDEGNYPGMEIFTFAPSDPGWNTVNDDVMGGVSSSQVEITAADVLLFSGNMSLENNGGFASVRSKWKPLDLSEYDGILMRVKGDGNIYRFRIRSGETGRDVSYNALFETTADTWEIVFVPFTKTVPTYRGFVLDVAPLDPSDIGSFGFMLSDKQAGAFELSVDWIRAITNEDVDSLSTR